MSGYFWFEVFVFVNVLLVTVLGINVSRVRIREGVPHGSGGNLPVKKAVRAHGNAMEHVAIFALVVLALELAAAPAALLGTLVAAFSVARFMHPFGMLGQAFWARRTGAAVTFLCELAGVIALLPVVLMN
jgi:hypothetical protein